MFRFDTHSAKVFKAIRIDKFILFKFSGALKNTFSILFLAALLFFGLSFWDITSSYFTARMLAGCFAFFLIFCNIDLFRRLKIKKASSNLQISEAAENPESHNLAEFLSFDCAKMVVDCIKLCNKKKIAINSTALLYSVARLSKDASLVCFRLGMQPKKLQSDLKNRLETMQRQVEGAEAFANSFEATITTAIKIASERGCKNVGENELLAALALEDEFFRDKLVEFDLKPEDVKNLTLWLNSAEDSLEKSRQFWSSENLARSGALGRDWLSGYTVALDKFSTDLRTAVSRWKFKEIIGHKKEIEQAEVILSKENSPNVLLVGDPGTGRKSIVEAIAQKCYLGASLPKLNGKRVVELDLVLLAAQIPDFEKLEFMLDQIFKEVASSGNVILAIDDLENFVGQDAQKAGTFDISGILSKYLPLPNFQFIGITTNQGLHKNIEKNSSFADLFEKVEVSEVSETETINILQTMALELEYKHKILVLYPAIREIINLTERYMPSLPFPQKGLDVLNEAVGYIQKLREKVILPHHIAEIISKRTGIPVGKMEFKEKETLLNLENLIHKRIVNQAEAVTEISTAMRRARAGISSKRRPMGTFLFMGPTGVGKTETAKALSEIYFGPASAQGSGEAKSEQKMIRLDMSEFQSISDVARLIGAVSPVEIQGLLTTPVRETPFSLVLLDEIEKAHPNILNLFLQVLDEGQITDGQGRKVIFSNTIIICTSNAGAEMIFEKVEKNEDVNKDELLNTLFKKGIFKPEFINRFDATVLFHPLTKENLMDIAQLNLQGLQKNLKEKDIDFEITESLKHEIVEMSYKPEFGAREMRRVVQDKVESVVAQALLEDKIKKGDKIQINPETFEIIVNPID